MAVGSTWQAPAASSSASSLGTWFEVRAALVGLGQGCRRGSFGPRTGPALSGGDGGRGGQWPWEQDHKELQPLQPTGQ